MVSQGLHRWRVIVTALVAQLTEHNLFRGGVIKLSCVIVREIRQAGKLPVDKQKRQVSGDIIKHRPGIVQPFAMFIIAIKTPGESAILLRGFAEIDNPAIDVLRQHAAFAEKQKIRHPVALGRFRHRELLADE
ncbi:hypothetical protein ESA_01850 [Cronobacter sakazakii ATCC BAA-894]|uniref:Uncharacterized protein n=1 Tax=Cronobacter sakazakii (strain ATCC BAA-894) TaxID=290339 RepID=A7MK89_CROS8|nr:hypothetical protein ESA_01850 [Cronobacter sakazakii ATCC BAA-894]